MGIEDNMDKVQNNLDQQSRDATESLQREAQESQRHGSTDSGRAATVIESFQNGAFKTEFEELQNVLNDPEGYRNYLRTLTDESLQSRLEDNEKKIKAYSDAVANLEKMLNDPKLAGQLEAQFRNQR